MDLKVFPNPADDYLVIETGCDHLSTFKLFDALGTVVVFTEVKDHERISLVHLEPGLYQYKLISDSRLQIGKLKIIREGEV
jgi:hypothetical protein